MTSVLNTSVAFAAESLRGFLLAHGDLAVAVPGGVVRADRPEGAKVAVVSGGGSGHYPAFCGWVGPGLVDGAAVGDVFASPSAEQIVSVSRAADNGGGVLLCYGNYAGDVLNFGAAAERLAGQGVVTTSLPVSDDVASAPASERGRRRGTAGDLVVLKIAGSAAADGLDLAAVTALATRANDRTFSFGVAFAGCTLPGADSPLFSLPDALMGVGMGVHGEPGIGERPVAPARELARVLVGRLLEERPADADGRVLALLNSLGSTGAEELFVLWGEVYDRLVDAGLDLVDVRVGELITSLDMAGLSLTVCWLDDDLERAWFAPCRSAEFSRSGEVAVGPRRELEATAPSGAGPGSRSRLTATANPASAAQAATAAGLADAVLAALVAAEDELGRLDAVAGDGDHGRGMARGAQAAAAAAHGAVAAGAGLGDTVATAGDAWAAASGGTSGALWGALLRAAGEELGDDAADPAALFAAVVAARDALVRVGGAVPGDKTMLDALDPFVAALGRELAQRPWPDAWAVATQAATAAAAATAGIVARRGRARPLGERSLGHPDPGAVSLALVVRTLGAGAGRPAAGPEAS